MHDGRGRFEGKTVVITGASSGIGAASARYFAAEGAQLVLASRGRAALEAVAADVGGLAVPTDVVDAAQCRALLDTALSMTGRIDVLVNNAGAHTRGPVLEQDPESLAVMVDVNLRAPVLLSRLVLPHMVSAGAGAIVQVASLAGRVEVPGSATYSATKFGLRAFSRALGEELDGTGVTVSVVSPGPVATPFILGDLDRVTDLTLSQPMSSAEDVAKLVVRAAAEGGVEYVIPKASRYLTTLGYLSPLARSLIRPIMERRGRKQRERLRASRRV